MVEVGCVTMANRGRALMIHANVPLAERYKLFKEAFLTATYLDGLVIVELDGKCAPRVEHWSGKIPKFAHHLRTCGEAGVVKTVTKTTKKKLSNRGTCCMFVGYSLTHEGDVYRMWDKVTNRVHITRTII